MLIAVVPATASVVPFSPLTVDVAVFESPTALSFELVLVLTVALDEKPAFFSTDAFVPMASPLTASSTVALAEPHTGPDADILNSVSAASSTDRSSW